MDFFSTYMPVAAPTVAIGIIAFIIIAIVQEARTGGKAEAVRTAFVYVTSLVTLYIALGAVVFLLQQGMRAVLPQATPLRTSGATYNPPPSLMLSTTKFPMQYSCTSKCDFTDADKLQLTDWKTQYAEWKKNNPAPGINRYTNDDKRGTINALSFLIVAFPLYFWFFIRQANRDARQAAADHNSKSHTLRTAYFYIVAFSGLLGLIISGAMLINTGLRSTFGLSTNTKVALSVPAAVTSANSPDAYGVNSVANCQSACGFTVADKQLAAQWQSDYDRWQSASITSFPRASSNQTDVANLVPLVILSGLLFWYHFRTVRKETKD